MPPLMQYQFATLDRHADQSSSSFEKAIKQDPLSKSLTKPKAGKTVKFNERVRAKRSLHITQMTKEEIASVWYKASDFQTMRNQMRFEASLLENDFLMPKMADAKYCAHGLESYTQSGVQIRRDFKKQGLSLVLEEQEMQKDEGSCDPEYIANIYKKLSELSLAHARSRALKLC